MKSFSIGAAAALIAAYTIADEPETHASAQVADDAASTNLHYDYQVAQERRGSRGLPPFWGRSGLSRH
ncbi:MAG: hypothetical protein H0T47_17465 [Planctomycetaceae bacterium]|nr:hypothetical protein [Planctomycetaceae bacterium]